MLWMLRSQTTMNETIFKVQWFDFHRMSKWQTCQLWRCSCLASTPLERWSSVIKVKLYEFSDGSNSSFSCTTFSTDCEHEFSKTDGSVNCPSITWFKLLMSTYQICSGHRQLKRTARIRRQGVGTDERLSREICWQTGTQVCGTKFELWPPQSV